MADSSNRLDRRFVRSRKALVAAGYSLFAERGLHDVSIDEIVERASISKQTFYNHFDDKAALAREIYLSIRDEIEAEVHSANDKVVDPATRLARGICVYVAMALSHPDHIRFITRMLLRDIARDDPANRGIIRDLTVGLAQGRFAFQTLDTATAFVLGASEPLLLTVLEPRNKRRAAALTREFLQLILCGLSVSATEAVRIATRAARQLIR